MEYVNQINDGNDQRVFMEDKETMLISKDGIGIFFHAWIPENPQRILLYVQGLGGHGGNYRELACQIALKGTMVVAPDLRGQGQSEGVRGDIDRFDRYLMDVEIAVRGVTTMWPDAPIFMLSESMGASIAVQFIVRGMAHHITSAGLVLVSPVFSSSIHPMLAVILAFLRSLLIAPTHLRVVVTGREELGCRDPAFNALLLADPLFVRLVSARFLSMLTIWLWQSKHQARQINLPLPVLLGGRDTIARRSGTSAFLSKVSSREQRIVTFPQAYHCLLREPDTPDVVEALNFWQIPIMKRSSNLSIFEGV